MRKTSLDTYAVKLSSLLKGENIDYDANFYRRLKITDDCQIRRISDLSILNCYIKRYGIKEIDLINFLPSHHKAFLDTVDCQGIDLIVGINDSSISKLFATFNPEKERLSGENPLTLENMTRINVEDRYKLDKSLFPITSYESKFLNSEEFLKQIDYLAYQISKYAKTDIEKVVLVDKIIYENITYDWECVSEYRKRLADNSYIQKDSFNRGIKNSHIGHFVQSIFTRKLAVCSAISAFATILLNHPLLNVKTKYINTEMQIRNKVNEADRIIDNHAWNNVKIDNKWYTCDFTWSTTLNKQAPLNSILIKPRCKNTSIDNDTYSLNNYSRFELNSIFEKFKDVHISIPKLQMQNTDLVMNPTSRLYGLNTRRQGTLISVLRRPRRN